SEPKRPSLNLRNPPPLVPIQSPPSRLGVIDRICHRDRSSYEVSRSDRNDLNTPSFRRISPACAVPIHKLPSTVSASAVIRLSPSAGVLARLKIVKRTP